ncbi:MAG: hypothetical protein J5822_07210 [Eubacteriaceae bacterium]|nr:hypothetical protein [Eubacteriaceae bacterium]
MKYVFKDSMTGQALLSAELPEGFSTRAALSRVMKGINQDIEIRAEASGNGITVSYMPGWSCMYEKVRVPSLFGAAPRGRTNDAGAYYSDPTPVQLDLDTAASNILGEAARAEHYYALSDTVLGKARQLLGEFTDRLFCELETGASISPIPIGNLIRGYLADGALGVYPAKEGILAVCLFRIGVEADVVQNARGISEMLWDGPFGSAPVFQGTVTSSAVWTIPYICSMMGKQDDLAAFARFVETVEISDQVRDYTQQLWQYNVSSQVQQARANTELNQRMINEAWAQQQRGWAASDALRDSISRDLDSFHSNLNQRMAENDMRFTRSSCGTESSDDRIQRWRHESMMGVETYERGDGTDVEFDSRADRVFENDLDPTVHFGTEHYYDDWVPDGWHELNKK